MTTSATFFRRLLPVLLLAGLAFSSCGRKDCDPRPSPRCGTQAPAPPKPSGSN